MQPKDIGTYHAMLHVTISSDIFPIEHTLAGASTSGLSGAMRGARGGGEGS